MRRLSVFFSWLTVVGLAASACGQANRSNARGGPVHYATDGTFTMALNADLGAFDPYQNAQILGPAVLAYDSLVNLRRDGKFVSGLAQKWTTDVDSATFTLRAGITCSDGSPLTAGQIAKDLNYLSNPNNSPAQYGTNVPTVPYTVTGDDSAGTVKVTMKRPYGFLLNTLGQVPIVCAAGMKNRKMLAAASNGTGPFVLTSVVPGQRYTFTVRKGYSWGPDGAGTAAPGTPAKVVLKVITNETTAANLLLTNQLNFAKITGKDEQRLTANGLDKVDWKLAGAWLSFNQFARRSTADRRVRQALVAALDRDQVIKVSTGGTGSAAGGLVSMQPQPCTGDTVTGQLPAHDPAAAGTLLDQAGWTKGANGLRAKGDTPLTINLHYSAVASVFEQSTAELLAQQWKALGIDVKITGDSAQSAVQVLFKTSNWDVYITSYDFSMPSQMVPYLSGSTPPQGTNVAYIDNRRYNELAAKAVTLTPPTACTYWSQAERAIVNDVDIAPISNRVDRWFLRGARAQIQRYDAPVPTSIRVFK